jgi:hypothetical protein
MRKISTRRMVRDEKGYVLIAALLVLLVLGLISGPVLSYMVSGLRAGHTFETGATELYAADAGAQDAIWKIQNGAAPVCTASPGPWCYIISDVNGRPVQVCIEYDLDAGTHIITSTAVTYTGGNGVAGINSSTSVEAYLDVEYMDLSALFDNAIVSDNSIIIYNGVLITGNVTSGGTVDDKTKPGDIDGTITPDAELEWPEADALSTYYLKQVTGGVHYYADTTIDLNGFGEEIGPLYVDGTLDVRSSDQDQEATLTLNDTVYVTGDTSIYGPSANTPLRIRLNGQTIFVNSDTDGNKYALDIKNCVIEGPGCIIAVGNVYLDPGSNVGSEDAYVLVMSVDGMTLFQPSGTFYGCIAGDLAVDVKSGDGAAIVNAGLTGEGDLNFPSGGGDDPNNLPPVTSLRIDSWEVSRQ